MQEQADRIPAAYDIGTQECATPGAFAYVHALKPERQAEVNLYLLLQDDLLSSLLTDQTFRKV